jgi:hypothetical protein
MKNTISKLMVVGALMAGGAAMAADAPAQPAKPAHAAKATPKPAPTSGKEMGTTAAPHAAKGAKQHKE